MKPLPARRGLIYLLLLSALAVVGLQAFQTLADARRLIDRSPSSIHAFQGHRLEIDYARFLEGMALYVAGSGDVDRERLTELFEVLWSRANLVMRAQSYEATRERSNIDEAGAELKAVLQRIEKDVFTLERDDVSTLALIRDQLSPFQTTFADITADVSAIQAKRRSEDSAALIDSLRKLDRLGWMVSSVVTALLIIFAVEAVLARRAESALADHKDHLEGIVENRTEALSEKKRKLERALERERELTALQRKFVSMVSHEFRTPLAIIDGAARRIVRRIDAMPSEKIVSMNEQIMRSVKRLTNLMEDTLAASRLEAGTIKIKPDVVDLLDLVTEICDEQQQISGKHRLHLDIDGLPATIRADQQLLRQIVSNLLSNAVKYSPNAENVWVTGRTEDGMASLAVRDEGVGIPSTELPKLFGRFFRASTSDGIPGTGIGLNLVKHLIELHGGRIEVTTEANQGSTFTVHLPIAGPVEPLPKPANDPAPPSETTPVIEAA